METIRDLSWIAQLSTGEILERFEVGGLSAVALLVPAREGPKGSAYRYRMLFSEKGERHPVYAVNLEASILGEWMITEQRGSEHRVVSRLPSPIDYEKFRVLALERALPKIEEIFLKFSEPSADNGK